MGPHGRPRSSQGIRRRRLLGSLRSAAAIGDSDRVAGGGGSRRAPGRPACARSTLKLCEFEGFSSRKQDRKWQAGQHPSCEELSHQPYPIPIPSPANFPSAPSPSELGFVQHQCVTATGGNAVAVGAESVGRGAQCTTPIPNWLRRLPKCCVYIYMHNGDLALAYTPI